MNGFRWVWVALSVAAGVVELVALLNRRRNDTLSEQFWLLLGVDGPLVCRVDGLAVPCPAHGGTFGVRPARSRRLPPAWVRVRRFVFVAVGAWLVIHLTTAWM